MPHALLHLSGQSVVTLLERPCPAPFIAHCSLRASLLSAAARVTHQFAPPPSGCCCEVRLKPISHPILPHIDYRCINASIHRAHPRSTPSASRRAACIPQQRAGRCAPDTSAPPAHDATAAYHSRTGTFLCLVSPHVQQPAPATAIVHHGPRRLPQAPLQVSPTAAAYDEP